MLSPVRLFVTPWIVSHHASLSMEFSRQEYLSGLPFPTIGDPPNPGFQPLSLMSSAFAGSFFTTSITCEIYGLYILETEIEKILKCIYF